MRKKKFVIGTAVCVMALSLFTGCNGNQGKDIGNEKAKTTALSDAGVAEDEVTRLHVNRNEDDGRIIYEVDFTVSSTGVEYDYEISAEDGSVLEVKKEESGNIKPDQSQNQSKTEPPQPAVSQEDATKLVLQKVPGATAQDLRIKLEQDDGIQKYEGDLIYEGKEYDFEIDASTGEFLEWQEDRVD